MPRKKVEVTRGDVNLITRTIKRGLDDGSPLGEDARKIYCAMVSGAFENFLNARLEYIVARLKTDLADPYSSREQDLFAKGGINVASLLLDWGEAMRNEYMSYANSKKVVNYQDTVDEPKDDSIIINSIL